MRGRRVATEVDFSLGGCAVGLQIGMRGVVGVIVGV